MTIPRGFTRCDECEGKGYIVEEHIRTVPEHHPSCDGVTCDSTCPIPVPVPEYERDYCPSCSGSGLVSTEKLREDVAVELAYYRKYTFQIQADAVLRKVAEHLGDRE